MPEAHYYPDWYNRDEVMLAQGQKVAPQLTLIENKVFVTIHIRTDISNPDDIVGRGGVTAVRNTTASPAKQLNWIYNQIFSGRGVSGPYTNLTDAVVDAAANAIAITKYFVDEMAEGEFGMPYTDGRYKRFWERVKVRCAEAGIVYLHFHTYGTFANIQGDPWQNMTGDGSHKQPNHPIFKALLGSQAAARKKPNGDSWDFYALFYGMGMGCNIKHYADQPDYASRYFNKAYAAEVLCLAFGATRGIPHEKLVYVDWQKIEGLGGDSDDLHNGFNYERPVGNLGKVKTPEHPTVDFDWQVGCIFGIGFVRLKGYVLFDVPNLFGTDPATIDSGTPHDWIPNNPGTPAPAIDHGYPNEPKRGHDAGFVAAFLYQQCNRTEGLAWQYCAYQVVSTGQNVAVTSDYTDILEHASANDGAYAEEGRRGRADAMYRYKPSTGALDVWVFDPSRAKDTYETLILKPFAGVAIQVTVQGCKLLLRTETVS